MRSGRFVFMSAVLTSVGCLGILDDPNAPDDPGPSDPPEPVTCDYSAPIDPGPALMRRLTNAEYAATIETVLGVSADATLLPAEARSNGYSNQSATQGVTLQHTMAYQRIAESTAASFVGSGRRDAIAGCDPVGSDPACVERFTSELGRRLYRRALTDAEVSRMVGAADAFASDPDPYAGASLIVEALLQSSSFLFRPELGRPGDAIGSLVPLSGAEIATRLSYLVLGSTPDPSLLDAGQSGELDTREGVQTAARTLLADPRAQDRLRSFGDEWFHINQLASRATDGTFTPALRDAMVEEAWQRLDDAIDSGSFMDLYTSRHGYVNDALADLYGVSSPGSIDLRPFDFPADSDRGGFFTTGAFLTVTSKQTEASPILRGVYALNVVLCDPPPPPPPNIAPTPPLPGESPGDTLARHSDDPACNSCHSRIDPIGLGLDHFDELGRRLAGVSPQVGQVRELDGADPSFTGGPELGQLIARSSQAAQCTVRQLFRWSFARAELVEGAPMDGCLVEQLNTAFTSSGHDFGELVVALTGSDAFRYRRQSELGGAP